MDIRLSDMRRIVVAVDPAATSGPNADETGIVVVAEGPHIEVPGGETVCKVANCKRHGFVLADESGRYTPDAWAKLTVDLFHRWKADRIIAEGNQGGEMVESVVRSVMPSAPFRRVTAKRGKRTRAEPVAALYEQGRVHHCGSFPILEEQLTTWTSDSKKDSPDRLDALVWGLVELGLTSWGAGADYIESLAQECSNCETVNPKAALVCWRCNEALPQPEPEPEPETRPEDPFVEPVPFSLVSGRDIPSVGYDERTRATMAAIEQFGPKPWTPFGQTGWRR